MNNYSIEQILILCLCLCIGSCIISWILTKCLIKLLPVWGLLDRPEQKLSRSINKIAMPRGGGIGVIFTFFAALLIYFRLSPMRNCLELQELLKFAAPMAILLPLGVLDDKIGLKAGTKFFWQAISAVLAWHLGFRLESFFNIILPAWSSCLLSIFWIVALINAFNMIDGLDGLASGVSIISSFCMGFIALSKGYSVLALILAAFIGAQLGFLYFNRYPAKLFMGDTGSMFIGYFLAVTGLALNASVTTVASIGIPLLICGIPVLDILMAIWRRLFTPYNNHPCNIFRGCPDMSGPAHKGRGRYLRCCTCLLKRLGTADKGHLHHRLLSYYNGNQIKTVYTIYGLTLVLGGVGIFCCYYLPAKSLLLSLLIIFGTFSVLIYRLGTIELWLSAEYFYHDFQTLRVGHILSHVFNPFMDLFFVFSAYYLTASHPIPSIWPLLRNIAVVMAILVATKNYRVFWNFSAIEDYCRLISALVLGFVASYAITLLCSGPSDVSRHTFACCAACTLILMERLLTHFFRTAMVRRYNTSGFTLWANPPKTITVLVGISSLCRLYRNELLGDFERARNEQLVGLIGRDPRFCNGHCYGMKVLGSIFNLEETLENLPVSKMVITRELNQVETKHLINYCKTHGITLIRLSVQNERLT